MIFPYLSWENGQHVHVYSLTPYSLLQIRLPILAELFKFEIYMHNSSFRLCLVHKNEGVESELEHSIPNAVFGIIIILEFGIELQIKSSTSTI